MLKGIDIGMEYNEHIQKTLKTGCLDGRDERSREIWVEKRGCIIFCIKSNQVNDDDTREEREREECRNSTKLYYQHHWFDLLRG